MDCRELESFLYPYLDGELVEGERTRFEGHLATCESCRKATDHEHAMLLHIRSRAGKRRARAARQGCVTDCLPSSKARRAAPG